MFGIIWGTIMTVGKGLRDHNINKENEKRRKESITKVYYVDSMGQTRLTSNNHLCNVDYSSTGYERVIDAETFEEVYNEKKSISNNEINKNKEDAEQRKATVYRIDIHRAPEKYLKGEPIGHVYKDFKTNNEYVIRVVRFHSDRFGLFVNIKTGKAERYTDYTTKQLKEIYNNSGILGDLARKNIEEYKRMYEHDIIEQWNIDNATNIQKVLYTHFEREAEFEMLEEKTNFKEEV